MVQFGRIHITLDKDGSKLKLTYDLTDSLREDALHVYDALKSFSNEVNKRFPDIKMWIEYPHIEYQTAD